MAKVKTPLDTDSGQQEGTAVPAPAPDEEKDVRGKEDKGKKESKDKAVSEAPAEVSAHVLALLQRFPGYEKLYIDADGGMYTVGTAAVVRKDAVLYRNPYYKS